jgi:hypothetical protein
LDPGTAVAGNTLILKTRSYLVNDDNLGLRQKAFAVIAKNGTYSGSTQWNLQMSATYYSATDTALHTAVIGTALDNATWTSLSGFTTTSGTAISASARYVDLAFTLTATATVTSATSVTIKSALLSSKVGANSSFLVTETFTSSTTWNRPTGVNYLIAVVGVGGGGGGYSGAIVAGSGLFNSLGGATQAAAGAGGAAWFLAKDVYIGDQTTVSIGVGAGGAGGTANSFSKAAAATTQVSVTRVQGSDGGASSFGAYFSAPGGLSTGGTTTTPTTIIYGSSSAIGGTAGERGNSTIRAAGTPSAGGLSPFTIVPYSTFATGATGGTVSGSGGTRLSGTATTSSSGIIGGAGAAGWVQSGAGGSAIVAANSAGTYGGGGVGASLSFYLTASGTVTGTAGDAGAGGTASGAGGGAGGAVIGSSSAAANWTGSVVSLQSGKGGDGGGGFVTIVYVA